MNVKVIKDVVDSLHDWIKYDHMKGGRLGKNDLLVFTTDGHDLADGHTYNLMVWRYRSIPIVKFYLGIRKVEFIFSVDFPKAITARLNGIWEQMSDYGMTLEYHEIKYITIEDVVNFNYFDSTRHMTMTYWLTSSESSSFFLPLFLNSKQRIVTVPVCDDTRGLL